MNPYQVMGLAVTGILLFAAVVALLAVNGVPLIAAFFAVYVVAMLCMGAMQKRARATEDGLYQAKRAKEALRQNQPVKTSSYRSSAAADDTSRSIRMRHVTLRS